jgi:hypothetical protein
MVVALLAAAVAAPAADRERGEPGPDVHIFGAHGNLERGVRCGTERTAPEQMAEVERIAAARAAEGIPLATSIPVVFHVIHNGSEGNIPDSMINSQLQVLNQAFSGTGFSFTLSRINRVLDRKAFTGCYSSQRFKQGLADDPAHKLNFYTCKPKGNILGYAYLPWSFAETDYRHGVVVLYSSLPGGSAAPYNLGDTGTHEVGHYLGLHHTFENGCNAPGDSVADTPAEQSAAFGCPVGRDTCASAGADPIRNFMDYTDDACMNTFSANQSTRMQQMVATYKPSLGQ